MSDSTPNLYSGLFIPLADVVIPDSFGIRVFNFSPFEAVIPLAFSASTSACFCTISSFKYASIPMLHLHD